MIRNPFEFTQYASSFLKENIVFDFSGIGLSGISELMSFVVGQVRIRQEAIRIGYISNNPGIPQDEEYELVSLDGLYYDTPDGIYSASLRIKDAVNQMFKGHQSGLYEKLAYKPYAFSGENPEEGVYTFKSGGFFHKIVNPVDEGETPQDSYFEEMSDAEFLDGIHVNFNDIQIFNNPYEFTQSYSTFNDYLKDQVKWINSVIAILNKLKYVHKKLVFSYGYTLVSSGNNGSGCSFSYTCSSNTVSAVNKPVEIILDMSEVVTSCFDGTSSYGYICVKWEAASAPSRFAIMPTKGQSSASTDILRKPIWGAPTVDPTTDVPAVYSPSNPVGYYDASNYDNRASSESIVRTWDPSTGVAYPVQANPILKAECITTDAFSPNLPFRDGNNDNIESDFACIKIDSSYFTTGTGSDWDNKIRLIVFPTCTENDSGYYWSVTLTCLGCTNCNQNLESCGGTPVQQSSSSSSSQDLCNFSIAINNNQSCLKTFDLDLSQVPFTGDFGNRSCSFCMTYWTFSKKDRIILLASKGSDLAETALIRADPSSTYGPCSNSPTQQYLNYRPFDTAILNSGTSILHPLLGENGESAPASSILFDSGCVGISSAQAKKYIITVHENDVEIDNSFDEWYKKIRLFIFGGCDPQQQGSATVYNINFSCDLGGCVALSSSSSSESSSSSSESSSSSSESSSSSSESSSSSSEGSICDTVPLCEDMFSEGGVWVSNIQDVCNAEIIFRPDTSGYIPISVICHVCCNSKGDICENPYENNCVISSASDICKMDECLYLEWIADGYSCCSGGEFKSYYKLETRRPFEFKEPSSQSSCCSFGQGCCCGQPLLCCLGYGSLVTMSNGSQKPVEEIKVGDELLSAIFDEFGVVDNPGISDFLNGWSISGPESVKLVKTYVKSIKIGVENSIYRFSSSLYLTYDHPLLLGNLDGTLTFRSSMYINSDYLGISKDLSYVSVQKPDLLEKRFVTFTIETEPYGAIFAGGILIHNGYTQSYSSNFGYGQLDINMLESSLYQKIFGKPETPYAMVDFSKEVNSDLRQINDGLSASTIIDVIDSDSSSSSISSSSATSSSSSSAISSSSSSSAKVGIYGSSIPGSWLKDASEGLYSLEIITIGDENMTFNNGGINKAIAKSLIKYNVKQYATSLGFLSYSMENWPFESQSLMSSSIGKGSADGSGSVMRSGVKLGPPNLSNIFFNNTENTSLKPGGFDVDFLFKNDTRTFAYNDQGFSIISNEFGNFSLSDNLIYRVVIAVPSLGQEGAITIVESYDRLDKDSIVGVSGPTEIIGTSLGNEIRTIEHYLVSTQYPVYVNFAFNSIKEQERLNGSLSILMHQVYSRNDRGFAVSNLHSSEGSVGLLKSALDSLYNSVENNYPLLEIYFTELVERQIVRGDPCRVIVWISSKANDSNPIEWYNTVNECADIIDKAWSDAGLPINGISYMMGIGPPSVPNDDNQYLSRNFAKTSIEAVPVPYRTFYDVSERYSYTEMFNEGYFESPSDTIHLSEIGYEAIHDSIIASALVGAGTEAPSSSSGITVISSSSSSSSIPDIIDSSTSESSSSSEESSSSSEESSSSSSDSSSSSSSDLSSSSSSKNPVPG